MGVFTSALVAAEDVAPKPLPGQAETALRCLICHGDTQAGQARLAPPMVMVKRHYQSMNQAEFEKAVLAWVKKPDAKKSRMPGAIRRFNLMPTFPIPEPEIKLIANYIYQTEFEFPGQCGPGKGQTAKGAKGKKAAKGCDDANCGQGKGGKSSKGCDEENCGQGKGQGKGKGANQGKNKGGCGDGCEGQGGKQKGNKGGC